MPELPSDAGRVLLPLARGAIAAHLGGGGSKRPHAPWLAVPGASFVTLTQDGALRGCIGSLAAHRPLGEDVAHNAVAAAVHDPRFSPLPPAELDRTRIEVSVLSEPEPLTVRDEDDAANQLRPAVDGVVVSSGWHRATFLPQVWAHYPDAHQFLRELKRKAGLPAHSWDADLRLSRYTVTSWEE